MHLRKPIEFLPSAASALQNRSNFQRRLPICFRLLAIGLGALDTWAAARNHSMNADGISYLDIGDAYFGGDWNAAINSVWSPLYSWILGLAMQVVHPSMRWEFPLVHLINFLVYLGAFACFEFFWHQVLHYKQSRSSNTAGDAYDTLPTWSWMALGYLLFIWSSLALINIWAVTPDMLMAAFVYLAAGLVLRIRMRLATRRTFMLLGIVLGLAYLTKAVMFPLAFVFLAVTALSASPLRPVLPGVLTTLLLFLIISLPFVIAISSVKGRWTFGEAGRLTYVRLVNGVPYPHWQGETRGSGTPLHPSRKIFREPAIFEFASPVEGTYPISYDPSYWYEGVKTPLNLKRQLGRLLTSAIYYFELFFHQQGALTIGFIILYLMRWRDPFRGKIIPQFGLSVVAVVALLMYALVYVEDRYVAVFTVLFWADIFANARLPRSTASRKLASCISLVMILLMLANVTVFHLQGFRDLAAGREFSTEESPEAGPPSWPGEVAQQLHQLGVRSGEAVAVIGYAFDSYWARLARVKIVAEMFGEEADPFWLGQEAFRFRVLEAFAGTGARAVVAEHVPDYAMTAGWHRVGRSNYFIYLLDR